MYYIIISKIFIIYIKYNINKMRGFFSELKQNIHEVRGILISIVYFGIILMLQPYIREIVTKYYGIPAGMSQEELDEAIYKTTSIIILVLLSPILLFLLSYLYEEYREIFDKWLIIFKIRKSLKGSKPRGNRVVPM